MSLSDRHVGPSARTALLGLVAFSALAPVAWGAPGSDVAAAIERQDYARAARELRVQLAATPDDVDARFTLARVLGWSGDYAGALAEYDALLAGAPANVDYVFGRAQVLIWTAHDEEAVRELDRARALAPQYEDVWRLEQTVLERGGDRVRLATFRDEAARQFPGAVWWKAAQRSPEAPLGPATQLTAGTVHESLSNGAADWSSLFVQVDHRRANGNVHARVSRDERFGLSDATVNAGADWRLAPRWSAGADVGLGADADFAPRSAVSGWGLRSFPQGWETEFRLAQRTYSETRVTSTAFGLGRYFGNFRAAYRVDLAQLDGDASATTHSATLNYYRSAKLQFNVSLVGGQEAESVGPAEVLRTDVRGFTVGARHALGGRLRLSWWAGAHRQGDLYRRRYVGLSVTAGL
jgi:YaiO family outer membrane protein